jgi:hypothetical protein
MFAPTCIQTLDCPFHILATVLSLFSLMLCIVCVTENIPSVTASEECKHFVYMNTEGHDSSVDIATHYGLDAPGSYPGGIEIFCTRPDRPFGRPSLLYNGFRVFPGGKAAEAWC